VARRRGASFYLLHTDRLGSVIRATDASGANVAIARYAAYGALLTNKSNGPMPTDRGFTGQIRDGSASGWELYFFRSRYYNAATGRFLEPDTIVPDPKNPQALNRFSYALNNPLKRVDPSGHLSESQVGDYLKGQYGDKWRDYLARWKADPNWWAAISVAQPGDYLGAGKLFGRLEASPGGFSVVSQEGAAVEPLSGWASRGVDMVLHQVGARQWHVQWARSAPPDYTTVVLDEAAMYAAEVSLMSGAIAVATAWIPFVGEAIAGPAAAVSRGASLASAGLAIGSVAYGLLTGGMLNVDGQVMISQGEMASFFSLAASASQTTGLSGKLATFGLGFTQVTADIAFGSSANQTYFAVGMP